MAVKSIDVPAGFTEVVLLFPTSRIQSAIDTFAENGGYNAAIHGSDRAMFAKRSMASMIDQVMLSRDAQVAVANATSTNKVTAL